MSAVRVRPGEPDYSGSIVSIEPFSIESGRSAAWLARLPWEQEAVGSNPTAPTIYLHISQSLILVVGFFLLNNIQVKKT